jgi:hypothetical protein
MSATNSLRVALELSGPNGLGAAAPVLGPPGEVEASTTSCFSISLDSCFSAFTLLPAAANQLDLFIYFIFPPSRSPSCLLRLPFPAFCLNTLARRTRTCVGLNAAVHHAIAEICTAQRVGERKQFGAFEELHRAGKVGEGFGLVFLFGFEGI